MNNIAGRMVYDNAIKALDKAFNPEGQGRIVDVRKFKTTQSYIRLEQALVVGPTLYNFPLMINQGATFNTEQRLNLQDSFVISSVGMFFALPSSAVAGNFQLFPAAAPFIFPAFAAMQTFYNGKMTISVNNNTILPAWDLYRHQSIPETQQTAAFGAASPLTENNGGEDGFYPCEPNLVLVGAKNYQIQIELPAGLAAVDAFSRVVILFRGVLAQNSTVVS